MSKGVECKLVTRTMIFFQCFIEFLIYVIVRCIVLGFNLWLNFRLQRRRKKGGFHNITHSWAPSSSAQVDWKSYTQIFPCIASSWLLIVSLSFYKLFYWTFVVCRFLQTFLPFSPYNFFFSSKLNPFSLTSYFLVIIIIITFHPLIIIRHIRRRKK